MQPGQDGSGLLIWNNGDGPDDLEGGNDPDTVRVDTRDDEEAIECEKTALVPGEGFAYPGSGGFRISAGRA